MSTGSNTVTAYSTRNPETGRSELHADTVSSFSDLNMDLPFDYGDAIYDEKRGNVRIPRAIGPNGEGTDGFRVYCHTYEVRESAFNKLKITDSGTPGMRGISMKLLLTILDEETTTIVDADGVKA